MGVHPGVHRLAAIVGAGDGAAGVRRVGRRRVIAARRRCGDRPARAFQLCGCARCWPSCCRHRLAANGVSAGVSSALRGNRHAGVRSVAERRHKRFSTPRPLRLIGFDPKESWHPTTNADAPCAPPHARPASRTVFAINSLQGQLGGEANSCAALRPLMLAIEALAVPNCKSHIKRSISLLLF